MVVSVIILGFIPAVVNTLNLKFALLWDLAPGAEMRAALPDHDALNRRAAFRTRLTGPLVDSKILLKITAPVYPIDAGPISLDAGFQHLPDACP